MRQRPEWAHGMLAFASFPLSDDCVRIGARALFELDCVCLPFWRKSLRQIKTRARRGSPSHPLHSKEARSEKFFQVEADTILGKKRFYIRSKDQRSTIKEK